MRAFMNTQLFQIYFLLIINVLKISIFLKICTKITPFDHLKVGKY